MNRVARALLIAAVLVAPTAAGAVELGEIVFTELMIAPAAGPEWIELYNPTTGDLDLQGCVLTEEDNEYVIDEPLVLESRDFALLARSSEDEDCTIYDDTGSCVRAPDLLYGSLSLNNGDPETLALTCDGELIDSVTYDWGEYEDDCDAAGTEACTVNLHPERQTAVDNDEWVANWCVPFEFAPTFDEDGNPVAATPWAVGACVVPGAPCGEGDAVITEFMIAPDTTSREWFEVKVTTGSGCDFQGCEIWEGLEPDPPVAFCESAAGDWDCHPVDVPGGSLNVPQGEYALFAKSADEVIAGSDYPYLDRYSGISFANSDPGWLHLVCNGDRVDSAPYDWQFFASGCPQGACSVNLPADREDPTTNESLDAWCLPPAEPEHPSSDGESTFTGTPGAAGECLALDWPLPGEVVFSELMIAPQGNGGEHGLPEWFELANLTDRLVELNGCDLVREKLPDSDAGDDDDSAPVEVDADSYRIGDEGYEATIQPSSASVFVKSRCIDASDAGDFGTCEFGDDLQYVYGALSFGNGDSNERLSLFCPDGAGGDPILIDTTVYNQQRMGNRARHSMEFDVTVADAADVNDDFALWCEASFDDCIPGTVNDEAQCHFGTPGVAGRCKTGLVTPPPSGAGCVCSESGRTSPLAFAVVVLLLSATLRRREP